MDDLEEESWSRRHYLVLPFQSAMPHHHWVAERQTPALARSRACHTGYSYFMSPKLVKGNIIAYESNRQKVYQPWSLVLFTSNYILCTTALHSMLSESLSTSTAMPCPRQLWSPSCVPPSLAIRLQVQPQLNTRFIRSISHMCIVSHFSRWMISKKIVEVIDTTWLLLSISHAPSSLSRHASDPSSRLRACHTGHGYF
jgi:hypothetical protein